MIIRPKPPIYRLLSLVKSWCLNINRETLHYFKSSILMWLVGVNQVPVGVQLGLRPLHSFPFSSRNFSQLGYVTWFLIWINHNTSQHHQNLRICIASVLIVCRQIFRVCFRLSNYCLQLFHIIVVHSLHDGDCGRDNSFKGASHHFQKGRPPLVLPCPGTEVEGEEGKLHPLFCHSQECHPNHCPMGQTWFWSPEEKVKYISATTWFDYHGVQNNQFCCLLQYACRI